MSAETSAEQTETEMWKDEPISMLLKIQDQLTSLRSLVELQEQMREVQGGLQSLRSAVAAQGNQLQQVQALMKASHVTSVDALAAPDSEPPMLPGEIVMEMSPKLLHHKKSATIQSRSPGLGGGIAALNKPRIMSMDQIEAHTAHVLLAPKALTLSRSAQSSKSRHEDEELEDFGEEPNDQPVRTFTSRQLTTNPNIVLQSCRRMSLDDLRTNHDAILAATTAQHTITRQSGFLVATDSRRSVLPRVANFWLTVLGIWDLEQVRSGCVLFAISFILLALSALVLYLSSAGLCDPYISATTLCYLVGVLAAAWRLRWSQIHGMLSREDGGLEDYARSSGFLDDWRSTSKRRFKEVLGFLFVMLCCRWLAYASDSFVDTGHPESPVTCGCFSVVALFFTAIVYIHLHIVAGMELAIDSFSINFYKEMDMELALGEWNTVQATLRQLSTKLSTSMLLLGSSCGASLLLLVQLTVFEQEEGLKAGLPFLAFSSWLFPPVLLFLYAMMRAAGVTEKASRVPPLVNSWTFDNDGDDDHPAWMDQGRQYIVQYMIQSEAGFYLQGVRLHVFQVTKLCYYFAAFIFALFSQSWA